MTYGESNGQVTDDVTWSRKVKLETKGGATSFKVEGTSSRAERAKKFFLTPYFWLTCGDIKQDITVFITAIMTYKRLCLPALNDYNIGLCDYCGYGETETVRECHFWVLVTVYY